MRNILTDANGNGIPQYQNNTGDYLALRGDKAPYSQVIDEGGKVIFTTSTPGNIQGSVTVSNFPSSYTISNFPSSFSVSNFPSFPENQKVTVSNLPDTQKVTVSNLPSNQNVTVSNFPGTQNTKVVEGSAQGAVIVTPQDNADLPKGTTKGIYIGGPGAFRATLADGTTATFEGIAQGMIHPISAKRVYSSGTTATMILAIY